MQGVGGTTGVRGYGAGQESGSRVQDIPQGVGDRMQVVSRGQDRMQGVGAG